MNYISLIVGSSLILFGFSFFLRPLLKIAAILFLMYIGFSLIADFRTKDQQIPKSL